MLRETCTPDSAGESRRVVSGDQGGGLWGAVGGAASPSEGGRLHQRYQTAPPDLAQPTPCGDLRVTAKAGSGSDPVGSCDLRRPGPGRPGPWREKQSREDGAGCQGLCVLSPGSGLPAAPLRTRQGRGRNHGGGGAGGGQSAQKAPGCGRKGCLGRDLQGCALHSPARRALVPPLQVVADRCTPPPLLGRGGHLPPPEASVPALGSCPPPPTPGLRGAVSWQRWGAREGPVGESPPTPSLPAPRKRQTRPPAPSSGPEAEAARVGRPVQKGGTGANTRPKCPRPRQPPARPFSQLGAGTGGHCGAGPGGGAGPTSDFNREVQAGGSAVPGGRHGGGGRAGPHRLRVPPRWRPPAAATPAVPTLVTGAPMCGFGPRTPRNGAACASRHPDRKGRRGRRQVHCGS